MSAPPPPPPAGVPAGPPGPGESSDPRTRRIGPYHIGRTLDDGGIGQVFLGRDVRSGVTVAVKQLRPDRVHLDPRFRRRLRREVAAASRLPRFCTVPVLAADVDADPPWVATEYVDAPNLDQVLVARGRLPASELETFAMGLAVALWAFHAHDVIHQGLKPSHVLHSPVGLRVIDFGTARVVPEGDTERVGQAQPDVGAADLAYLAPEQVRGDPVTPAVDVFAWAGLVTTAATGRPPFGAGEPARSAILTGEPDLGDLAGPLRDAVTQAFRKRPDHRPSAVELVRQLSAIRGDANAPVLPAPARQVASGSVDARAAAGGAAGAGPVASHPGGWSRRRMLLTTAAAAGAAAAATVTAVRWLSGPAAAGELVGILAGHTAAVDAVAVGELDGEAVAVSASRFDRTARVWHLSSGDQIAQLDSGPEHTFRAVAVGTRQGVPVALLGSPDPLSLLVWDLRGDEPVELPFTDHDGATYRAGVVSVAVGDWDGGPVVVSAGLDRSVRMWDLRTGRQLGETVRPDSARQSLTFELAVAAGQVDGAPVAVVAGQIEPPWATVWDLTSGAAVNSLTGHVSEVHAVAIGALGGRPVIVSGSNDQTVRVWALATGRPIGPQLTGHNRRVRSLAFGEVGGGPVAVSGSDDQTVRVWDLAGGEQLGPELTGHTGGVTSVAIGKLAGDSVAVSAGGGSDTTIRIWRLPTPG